jgi:uncharacterized protein DUF4338
VRDAHDLRTAVVEELLNAGFVSEDGQLVPPPGNHKEVARVLHGQQRARVLSKAAPFIAEWEDLLIAEFAMGTEVIPADIDPCVTIVASDYDSALFRYASLQWSVPVSQGYGRRTKFLVRDRSNGKLIGIFALGDPVFNLRARDSIVQWNQQQRQERLYNVLDAFVLGAVDPYRQLLGGKLMALLTTTEDALQVIEHKYAGTTTTIQGVEKLPRPVLITTTSALGRSSVYNRLKLRERKVFTSVGFTEGYGHFQFSDELFARLTAFVGADQELRGNRYGDGPNWKIRTLRVALETLGFRGDMLRHGLQREVFLAPLGVGWRAFLRGETDRVKWYRYETEDIAQWYRSRWAEPRASRMPEYSAFDRNSLRLSGRLEAA